MKIAYQYRLRPTPQQTARFDSWLNLLRRQYNYRLAERFDWWERNRCDVNCCPLICHLPDLKEQPNYYSQKKDLINTKTLFPDYKDIQSQVLQDCIKRVDLTFKKWLKGDSNGKRSGRPRFKGEGRYHSFTFPQVKPNCLEGKYINLPILGKIKLIQHRPLPNGFLIKTATIIRKADGWYVILSLEDKSIPDFTPQIQPSLNNTLGIDLGLKEFLVDSEGENVTIPRHYRKSLKQLKIVQKGVSRQKNRSKNRQKAIKRLAKLHQKVANKRKDFHFKTANYLLLKSEVIAIENLNIKGLAKSRLSLSVNDAGWGQFISILKDKAEKAGQLVIEVNPNGTTQECSGCGIKVPKELKDRVHSCPHCQLTIDRDWNAAINIKYRAVGHSVLKAYRVSEAMAGVGKKPTP